MSAGFYYRRWTRMYIGPAAKYFQKYDLHDYGHEHLRHLANIENPQAYDKKYHKKLSVNHEEELNNKLIQNLFLKYPDLRYESISRQKYQADNFNSYSDAYAFIAEQKKLMKAGYNIKKAFELTEAKFQQKMKRKLDQTLISRGLAIGNRARSLLTIYQQQVQYESRLKMLRTKREVLKYERHLKEIDEAIKRPVGNSQNQFKQNYERIFQKITEQSSQIINKDFSEQRRGEVVTRMQGEFKDMFSQFYEAVGYKDRLRGLTDQQIKQQIQSSPKKIKNLSKQLILYLKNRGGVTFSPGGDIKMSDSINEKLKTFLYSSPTVKIAILNHLIGYQSPHFSVRKKLENQAKIKLATLRKLQPEKMTQEQKNVIKENKIKEFQVIANKKIPDDSRAYRILESAEQRLLRLQIKYLESFIEDSSAEQHVFDRLKIAIEEFRRVKFRMEKRYKTQVEGELMFPEHFALEKHPNEIEDKNFEYEDLLEYLRRKNEERRLKAIDQADDTKIHEMIQKQPCDETPQSEGQQSKAENI